MRDEAAPGAPRIGDRRAAMGQLRMPDQRIALLRIELQQLEPGLAARLLDATEIIFQGDPAIPEQRRVRGDAQSRRRKNGSADW
jgi:hypothetical protein